MSTPTLTPGRDGALAGRPGWPLPPVPGGSPSAATPHPTGPGAPAAAPVEAGPTFLAAAAIVAGSTALNTSLVGRSWVLPLVEVVAVIWLVGVGGRLIRVPTVVTVLLQAAGFAIALTSLFTSSGYGGVVPNRAVLGEAGALIRGAWQQIVDTAPPAPSTPELSFLIALSVGCAAIIADFLVAEARTPALVALPLLCLYSIPASIDGSMLPWYAFAGPAVIYALMLAVTGQPGRQVGGRAGLGLALNGTAITGAAAVAALVLAGSATSVGTTGRLPHTNGPNSQVGLNPFTSLHGSLRESATINLMTLTGLPGPDYLRTVALTKVTPAFGFAPGDLRADAANINGALPGSGPGPDDVTVTVNSTNFRDRYLPILSNTRSVTGLSDPWNYDAGLSTVFRADPVKPSNYQVRADISKPTPQALRADTVTGGGSLTETGALSTLVLTKAQEVTAKAQTAFDKAQALTRWFTDPANGFQYSLSVPTGSGGDALVDFLTNKRGYCEQFASAEGVMLRALNIPTRVVVGFTQGVRRPDSSYLITNHDAHAWVEVKFDREGWVRFDPTPPVGGQGGQQGFETTPNALPTPTGGSSAFPTRASAKLPNDPAELSSTGPAPGAGTQNLAGGTGSSSAWRPVLTSVLLVLVVLAVLLLPAAVRQGKRRRRLALIATGNPGAAAAAWTEIEDTAIDHGVVPAVADSTRATANRIARRAHLGEDAKKSLRVVVMAAEREWYSADSPAPEADSAGAPRPHAPGSADGLLPGALTAGVRTVRDGLRHHAPQRPLARLAPRSLRRR